MATVSYPRAVFDNLRTWGEVANRIGLRAEYLAALREMEQRLRTDPGEWGDPIWNLRGLSMVVYHRTGPIFLIRYGLHTDGTYVFVRDVELTPGSLLADLFG